MRGVGRITAGIAAAVVAAVWAAPAGAATTIGQTAPLGMAQNCAGATLFAQKSVLAPPLYDVPAGGGILTSWSVMGSGIVSAPELMVVLPEPADAFKIVANTEPLTVPITTLATALIRIPVSGGERLALWMPAGTHACYFADAGSTMRYRTGSFAEPGPGEVFPTTNDSTGYRLNVSATLELDADHDGFGDETQDRCPSNATLQVACPTKKKKKCKKRKKPKKKCKRKKKR